MPLAELLTRWTIRFALVGYFVGAGLETTARHAATGSKAKLARAAWTLGWLLYIAHVACAFAFYHQGSHAAAYLHTAERTQALVGWFWGGGLYFNYVFTAVWLFDAAWWWLAPRGRAKRPRWLTASINAFLWFMVANATIVFETCAVHWLGVAGCGTLLILWACCGGRNGAVRQRDAATADAV